METNLLFKIVGNYSMKQGESEECIKCKNAKWATILVKEEGDEYICIECILKELLYYQTLQRGFSDAEARAIAYEEK